MMEEPRSMETQPIRRCAYGCPPAPPPFIDGMQQDGKVVLLINAPTWLLLFEKYDKSNGHFFGVYLVGWWFLGGLLGGPFSRLFFYKGVKDIVLNSITSGEDVQPTAKLNNIIEQIILLR